MPTLAISSVRASKLTVRDDVTPPITVPSRKTQFRSGPYKGSASGVVAPVSHSAGDPTSVGATGGGAVLTVYNPTSGDSDRGGAPGHQLDRQRLDPEGEVPLSLAARRPDQRPDQRRLREAQREGQRPGFVRALRRARRARWRCASGSGPPSSTAAPRPRRPRPRPTTRTAKFVAVSNSPAGACPAVP